MTPGKRPFGGVSLGAAWSLVYIASSRLGTFGLSVFVARALGPAQAGGFGIALQASTLAAFIGVLNVGQALAQRLGESSDPAEQRRIIGVGLTLVLAGTVVTGGLLAALAPWIATTVYRDAGLAPVLAWCGPLAVATGLILWADGSLQGLHRFRQLALWGGGTSAVDLVVGGLAALAGLPALLAARVVVRLGSAFAVTRFLPDATGAGAAAVIDRRAVARSLLHFGGLAFASAALVVLGQNVLRLLLVRGSGLAAAGQFQVADTFGQALLLVPTAAGIAFLPAVARDRAAGSPLLSASVGRAIRRVTGFNLPLCLAAIVLGPLLIRLVFGGAYATAAPTLQFLAVAYALAGLTSVCGPVLLGRAEIGTAFLLNLLWIVVLVAALLLGLGAGGAPGAALALAVAYVAQLTVAAWLALRRWGIAPLPALGPFACTVLLPALALLGTRGGPGVALVAGAATLLAAAAVFARWAGPELSGALARLQARNEP